MTIRFQCPECDAVMKIRDEKAGTEAKCPKCKEPFTVPGGESADDDVPAEDQEDEEFGVDMPIDLTPEADLSEDPSNDDFDPMDILAGESAAASAPAKPDPPVRKPSVAELMRDFEGGKAAKKAKRGGDSESSGSASASAASVAGLSASGNASDLLAVTTEKKRRGETTTAVEPNETVEMIKQVAPKAILGLAGIVLLTYGLYWMMWGKSRDLPPLADVSGQLLKDGVPMKNVRIFFDPSRGPDNEPTPGLGSTGITDSEGYFTMMYFGDTEGVVPGWHEIRVNNEQGLAVKIPDDLRLQQVTADGVDDLKINLPTSDATTSP